MIFFTVRTAKITARTFVRTSVISAIKSSGTAKAGRPWRGSVKIEPDFPGFFKNPEKTRKKPEKTR